VSQVILEQVGRRFGIVQAVADVSLEIREGEFLTLLGPSGCGKTTTLRIVAGLEEHEDGRVYIGGRLVSDAARRWFLPPERRQVGMVFQSYAVWPHMTVFENVAFPLRVRHMPESEVRQRVVWALNLVGLEGLERRPATALSGGQQQRLAIARAIVYEPRVLLLDEPLSNLDAKLREGMRVELKSLQRRLGITTLYVTHDQEEAMVLSDRLAIMSGGRILQVGSPEEVYRRPASPEVAAFLGATTVLEGEVRAQRRGADGPEVEVVGPGWAAWCRATEGLMPGRRARVYVRADGLRLLRDGETPPAGEGGRWWGRVEQLQFRGGEVSVVVRADCGVFRVDVPFPAGVSEGDEVWVVGSSDRIYAF